MWFCSYHVAIEHHSCKSSRVIVEGYGLFIIGLRRVLLKPIRFLQCGCGVFPFSLGNWNSSLQAFFCQTCTLGSWSLHYWYGCWRHMITLSECPELPYSTLPSWLISSAIWYTSYIFTKLKSASSTPCCGISDFIYYFSSSMWCHYAAAERLFQVGSITHTSCLSNVSCIFKVSAFRLLYWRVPYWLKHPCVDDCCWGTFAVNWSWLQCATSSVPQGYNTVSSWCTRGLQSRESFESLNSLKESPQKLEQLHPQWASSPYHFIGSACSIAG